MTRPKRTKDPEYGWGCWLVCAACKGNPSYSFDQPYGCADCHNEGRFFEPEPHEHRNPKGGLEFF